MLFRYWLINVFVSLWALRPVETSINHCHTKFRTLRETQLRVCVVSLHYGHVGRMRARKKMKLCCLFRLLDPQKAVRGCGEAGKTVNLRESPPCPFCSRQQFNLKTRSFGFRFYFIFFISIAQVWWGKHVVLNRLHLATAILSMQILHRSTLLPISKAPYWCSFNPECVSMIHATIYRLQMLLTRTRTSKYSSLYRHPARTDLWTINPLEMMRCCAFATATV